ncbi:HAD hydrolase family protein [Streptomyces sp. NPDC007916]|uniref:HAD hydrolase family protein n=1 Tax=Streptomyces sp. NPDC007916 TaxID=3364792 RepID=UPI0036F02ADB
MRWTSSGPGLLEVSAPEADKVSAVASVLAGLGIGWERAVAFGDVPTTRACSPPRASVWP